MDNVSKYMIQYHAIREEEASNRLKKMITRYGQIVVEDEQRCKNIMGDYFGNEYPPEVTGLTTVLNEQVVKAIMTPPHGFPIEVWLLSQKQKVMDECGLREEVAMWAVESWALALGVIDVPLPKPQAVVEKPRVIVPLASSMGRQTENSISIVLAAGVEMEFMRVPAGKFLMGSDKQKDPDAFDDELPQHEVYLEEYWMGKHAVTNVQYEVFVKAKGHRLPTHWKNGKITSGKEKHPVAYVSWDDARAFCDWASRVSEQKICLPSEAEWEKAARGTDGRIYAWGNKEADSSNCNFNMNIGDTTVVGKYSPKGDSPYNCTDMSGNIMEWTRSLWGKDFSKCAYPYPYNSADGRENEDAGDDIHCVLRGGSFSYDHRLVRCAFRGWYLPRLGNCDFGFRVVVVPL